MTRDECGLLRPGWILFGMLLLCCGSACAQGQTEVTQRVAASSPIRITASDWPWWRGISRNGIANPEQSPPTIWNETQNVLWKTPVPGRGHGSPTVVGDRVFLATADETERTQSVLCFDRQSGLPLWTKELFRGGLTDKGHKRSSQASSTVACDGERIFVNLLNGDAVITMALSLDGEQLWQQKISDYVVHQGYGSSPLVYESLVIVTADNKGGGAIAALDRATGEVIWRHDRPQKPNYPSPILVSHKGRDCIVLTGCDMISSFDPMSGEKLWEAEGATTECVTSTVTDGTHVFTSGGYPRNHVAAVRLDGSGKIDWENTTRVYVPSMLVRDGYLYAVTDAGVAMCWNCATGEEQWKGRLGGMFNASPILVGDTIFAINEAGTMFLFRADPTRFESLGENTIPGEVFASPAICGGRIYLRIAEQREDLRQEMLYSLG
ncbi:MAG: PQQ-binding-like beta-propeller repeat protein, partial [Planctomycetaceae bacterium]|nr:PQQ-binding-like beta-propeller repeat protein [Planctomycetaceae bacterium]